MDIRIYIHIYIHMSVHHKSGLRKQVPRGNQADTSSISTKKLFSKWKSRRNMYGKNNMNVYFYNSM